MEATSKQVQAEMMARRRELIDLQKQQGGCVAIELRSNNLQFCYNPNRKVSEFNPRGDKFWIAGVVGGCPVTANEFDVYD